jgi:hypothetical protein
LHRLREADKYRKKVGCCALTGVAVIGMIGHARAAISPPVLTPEDGTTFDLFVADQYTYDDNLYRIPENFGPVASLVAPNATRDDRINTASFGGVGQWIVGRQAFDLDLRADDNRFAHNTELNNTSGEASLLWNWRVGSYFSGQAGADYDRQLASFAETRYLGRDLVDSTDYFGNARFQVGPRWAITGAIHDTDTTHGAPAAQYNDFRTKFGNVGVEYATGVQDTIGLEYQYTDGTFPQDYIFDGAPFNRDLKEDTTRFWVKYALTDKTQLNAYAGYLKHSLPAEPIGSFSGDIWRVTVSWEPTEKTQLVVAGWHELHAYLVNQTNYFVSKGGSISPVWLPTDKITVSIVGSREDQGYINGGSSIDTTNVLLLGARDDKVTAEQLNVSYSPRTRWTLNFFFRNERRDSNQPNFSYSDRLANVSVTYRFW